MTTIGAFANDIPKSRDLVAAPVVGRPRVAFEVASAFDDARSASRWATGSMVAVLATLTFIQATVLFSFYAPANGGTDQNGYHVTARLLSQGKGAGFRAHSPFSFVGEMMVLTETGLIYAKYPPGYPLLAGIGRQIGGPDAVYVVNPICTVLACAFSFFLFRTLLSEFTSLLAVIWLSWNPVVLTYANDGSSHASTLLCIIIGGWGIISWMQHRGRWRGALGAFCFGFAGMIRYSENLLILPILLAVVTQIVPRTRLRRVRIRESAVVMSAWAIPVLLLACFCWSAFGAPWKTGYAYCAEETGFGWKYFIGDPNLHRPGNWESLLAQINWMGLLMLWPIGLIGLVALVGVRWREGGFIAAWTIPSIVVYLCYYWAPAGEATLSYLRFFVPVIPAFLLTALWFIERGFHSARLAGIVGLGLMTALGVSINLWNTLPALESSLVSRQALADVMAFVRSRAPQGSSLFIADDALSDCLDAAGGYDLYNLQLFKNSSFTAFDRIMDDPSKAAGPDPRQRARIAAYWHLVSVGGATGDTIPKSNEELRGEQNRLLEQLLRSKSQVFFLLRTGQNADYLPDPARWQSTQIASFVNVPRVLPQTSPIAGASTVPRPAAADLRPPNPVTWILFAIHL